ncbi:J domain-containing protein [Brevundimonas sp.]|uniref:J domain-containing protein n=1 Tax=Brevundimonas sp. TaxID=1871086 RepID=UPI003AF548F3
MILLVVLAVGIAFWALVQLGRRTDASRRQGAMPVDQARSLLGLGPEATAAEVNAAWRRLMARAHPDQGGTEGLAAQLNAARDTLLKRR